MHYARVLRLPQYFRNLQRLGEIITVLVKHGFGDLVDRLDLFKYLETPLRLVKPAVSGQRRAAADFGERIRLVCEELGPTFIKLAQLISTRPNLFPEGIIRELRKLQDQVPPFPLTEAREIVQRELGATIESIFSSLEPLPLGSASVAQVH
ncbi:MAG: ABC transporter, partial [Proteobacteria bacterium]